MKIVAISDVHLDARLLGRERYDEAYAALMQSVDVAIKRKAAAWVFGGDLCDPDSGPVTFRAQQALADAMVRLASHGIPAIAISGNHDACADMWGTTTLTPLAPIERCFAPARFVVAERAHQRVLVAHGERDRMIEFHLFPYPPAGSGYDPAAAVRAMEVVYPDHAHVVLSHLAVPGIQPGEETTEMPRGRDVVLPLEELAARLPASTLVLQAHYHRRQVFEPEGAPLPVHVIGSPARFTFGEELHDPGFMIFEVA